MRPPADTESFTAEPFQRSEALWKCLQSAVDYFEATLDTPLNELVTQPFLCTGVMAFAIVTSSRLLLLEQTADWLPSIARRNFNYLDIMKRMSDRFDEADKWAQETGKKRRMLEDGASAFSKYSFKLRWIRQWFQSKVPPDQPPSDHILEPLAKLSDPQDAFAASGMSALDMGDFGSDEGFWQLLSTDWNPTAVSGWSEMLP